MAAGYFNFLMGPRPKPDVVPTDEGSKALQKIEQMSAEVPDPETAQKDSLVQKRDALWEKITKRMHMGTPDVRGIKRGYPFPTLNRKEAEKLKQQMLANPMGFKEVFLNQVAPKYQVDDDPVLKKDVGEFFSTVDQLHGQATQRGAGTDPYADFAKSGVEGSERDLGTLNQEILSIDEKLKSLKEKTSPGFGAEGKDRSAAWAGIHHWKAKKEELEGKRDKQFQHSVEKREQFRMATENVGREVYRQGPLQPVDIGERMTEYWPNEEFYVLTNERNKAANESGLVPELKKDGELTPVVDPKTAFLRELNNLPEEQRNPILAEMGLLTQKNHERKMAMAAGSGSADPNDPAAQGGRAAAIDDDPIQMVKDILNRPSMKYQESVWFFVATALATGLEAAAKIWARDTSSSSMVAKFLQNTFDRDRKSKEKEAALMLKAYGLRQTAASSQRRAMATQDDARRRLIQEAREMEESLRDSGDKTQEKLADEFKAINTNVLRAEQAVDDARATLRNFEYVSQDDPGKQEATRKLNQAIRYRDDLMRELHGFRRKFLHTTSSAIEAQEKKGAEGK